MKASTRSLPKRRIGRRIALGTLLLLSFLGAYAFKSFFARPGEASLQYVPVNARLVVSVDLSPSPQQTMTFENIEKALDKVGVHDIDQSFVQLLPIGHAGELLKSYVQRNGSFALLPGVKEPKEYRFLAMVGLSDGPAVSEILKQNGQPRFFKGAQYYHMKGGSADVAVMDNELVFVSEPSVFHDLAMVRDGSVKAITTSADYTAARNRLAGDANLFVLANPDLLNGAAGQDVGMKGWMGGGFAIRDGGLELTTAGAVSQDQIQGYAEFASHSLRSDLFDVLPTGAYGLIAQSNPSGIYDIVQAGMHKAKDGDREIADMEDNLQKEMQLNLKQDILPGFKGNLVVGVYPTNGEKGGADVLVLVDDLNGADPAALANKLRDVVQQQMAKNGEKRDLFDRQDRGDVQVYRLSSGLESDMQKSMSESMKTPEIKTDLLTQKTVCYAVVGKSLIASSSEPLLTKAIASLKEHTNALSSDSAYASVNGCVADGPQTIALFSLSHIAEGIDATVNRDKMDKSASSMVESALKMVENLKDPLSIKAKLNSDGSWSGAFFIPMDYEKMIDFAGNIGKQDKDGGTIPPRTLLGTR